MAMLIGVGAVLLAVLAVAGAVRVSADQLPTGAPVAPTQTPAPPPASEVAYAASTRTVTVRDLHATAPGAPFACVPDADPPSALFSSWLACSAPVHPRYNKTGGSWDAFVAVGVVQPSAVRGDLAQTTQVVQQAAVRFLYSGHPVTLHAARSETVPVGSTTEARRSSAQVHFRIAGLATTYDDLVLVVVRLDDGEYVAVLSAVPEDSPPTTAPTAATVIRSVEVG